MSRYVDIDALTQEVLASVEAEQVKTASDSETDLKTEIGKAIKEAANNIRAYDDTGVTPEDLQAVVEGAKLAVFGGSTTGAQMAGGLAGGTAGGALGGALGGAAGGMALGPLGTLAGGAYGAYKGFQGGSTMGSNLAQGAANAANTLTTSGGVQPNQPQQPMQRTASALGDELRKLAAQIRDQGSRNEEIRLTKAAQMLTAAVGLEHLTEGLK